MFTQPWSTVIPRVPKSQRAVTASTPAMRNRSPRMNRRPPRTKKGVWWTKRPSAIKRKPKPTNQVEVKEEVKSNLPVSENVDPTPAKDKASPEPEKDFGEKAKPLPHPTKDKLTG